MKTFIVISILLAAVNLPAQIQTDNSSFLNQTTLKIGYYSHYGNLLVNNGLSLGAEYTWLEKEKIKDRRKGQKTITNQLLLHGNLGYSSNFTSQTDNGLSAYGGLIWRRTGANRWQTHVELNPLGYYRAFLPATYEVRGNEVSEVWFPGRNYYLPSIGFGIGRNGKGKRYAGWYLNFNHSLRMPFNAGALPTFSIQYGHRFNLKK